MWINILVVGIGGALGSIARYLFNDAVNASFSSAIYPIGITLINLIGCFAIGFLISLGNQRMGLFSTHWRLFLVIGFLGGFTTFSSFAYEIVALVEEGKSLWALLDILIQVGGGIVFVALGLWLSRLIWA